MTVWLVTLNDFPEQLCASREGAVRVMQQIKSKFRGEQWLEVGVNGWSSPSVKSVRCRPMVVEA